MCWLLVNILFKCVDKHHILGITCEMSNWSSLKKGIWIQRNHVFILPYSTQRLIPQCKCGTHIADDSTRSLIFPRLGSKFKVTTYEKTVIFILVFLVAYGKNICFHTQQRIIVLLSGKYWLIPCPLCRFIPHTLTQPYTSPNPFDYHQLKIVTELTTRYPGPFTNKG